MPSHEIADSICTTITGWGSCCCEHTTTPPPPSDPIPAPLVPAVSGSLLAVGLPNVLKSTEVETSANGLWSPNGLYLFMQALASPQDSVALTQEDSRTSKKKKKKEPSLGSLSILGQWVDKCSCQWKVVLTSVDDLRKNKTCLDPCWILHPLRPFCSLFCVCWRPNYQNPWVTKQTNSDAAWGRKGKANGSFDFRSCLYHLLIVALWGRSNYLDCGWRRLYNLVFAPTHLDSSISQASTLGCGFPLLKLKAVPLCLRQFQQERKLFFQRKKPPVMTWGQVKDPSRLSTLSTLSFTSVPFQGQKFTIRFFQTEPKKRFDFI